jgi:predicted protein tyrosine phosphatase
MDIQILSRPAAIAYLPPSQPVALISITDPTSPDPSFAGVYDEMLRLKFWDTLDAQSMNDLQADEVVAFLERVRAKQITQLVVHCEAGVSRSAGTAAAIWRILGEPDAPAYAPPHCPNRWVMDKIAQAWARAAV